MDDFLISIFLLIFSMTNHLFILKFKHDFFLDGKMAYLYRFSPTDNEIFGASFLFFQLVFLYYNHTIQSHHSVNLLKFCDLAHTTPFGMNFRPTSNVRCRTYASKIFIMSCFY